eukprot:2487251-Prymnesium_polylepis.1
MTLVRCVLSNRDCGAHSRCGTLHSPARAPAALPHFVRAQRRESLTAMHAAWPTGCELLRNLLHSRARHRRSALT